MSQNQEIQQEYYNIEEQDLFDTYLLYQQKISVDDSQYKFYYFDIEITDDELKRLFPTKDIDPNINVKVSNQFELIEVKINI